MVDEVLGLENSVEGCFGAEGLDLDGEIESQEDELQNHQHQIREVI